MKYLKVMLAVSMFWVGSIQAEIIYDKSRDRNIPINISYPIDKKSCSMELKCSVAFLSAGYGVSHTKYSFLAKQLNELGYLVVAVAHELPQDPSLSIEGNLYETRSENWARGATTLEFLWSELQSRFLNYDFGALLLVGHSNGGDISAWLGSEGRPYIKSIITLDHRRVPLPRSKNIGILSIRGGDFPADKGVLPTDSERELYSSCVVKITESKHNDMSDHGPTWLKKEISGLVKSYLNSAVCGSFGKA